MSPNTLGVACDHIYICSFYPVSVMCLVNVSKNANSHSQTTLSASSAFHWNSATVLILIFFKKRLSLMCLVFLPNTTKRSGLWMYTT